MGALTNLQEAVFKIVLNAAATVALTGTVGVTSGNTTVVGSGTSFTAQLRAEDKLTINGNTVRVANVANNTILTLAASPGFSAAANTFAKQYFSGDVVPWGAMVPPVPGRTITINSTASASFAMSETLSGATAATVGCKLQKTNAHEKNKTLVPSQYVIIDTSTHTANTVGPWPLGLPDVYQIRSIRTSGTAFANPTDGTDVTSAFVLDNGQRSSFYDLASIKLVGSSSLSRYLLVCFDYFAHDFSLGSGFFCLNSYPIDDTTVSDPTKIRTQDVPAFVSPVDGSVLALRNCIDFRSPRVACGSGLNRRHSIPRSVSMREDARRLPSSELLKQHLHLRKSSLGA